MRRSFVRAAVRSGATLAFLAAGALLAGPAQIRFTYVDSASMEPAFRPGDRLVNLRILGLSRGDVVSFASPVDGQLMVKRLVGLPGDRVGVVGGCLRLNGDSVREPYLREPRINYDLTPRSVAAGEYFLLGDNRNNSEDSSVWGPVPGELLRGKVVFIYWPPARAGRLVPPAVLRPAPRYP